MLVCFDWPEASIRLERTKEAIQIINKLWMKEHGREITITTTISGAGEKDEKHQSAGLNVRGNNDSSVNFDGKYFRLKNARLYTPPSTEIPLYMGGSVLEATSLFAQIFLPLARQTPIALSFSIIILITLALVIIAPPLDSMNLASAMGRLTKPPLTTLFPLSCAIVANR